MTPAEAFAILGLAPGAAPAEVSARAKERAKVLHPDVLGTGDAGAFEVMRQARSTALAYALEEPCRACVGTGYKVVYAPTWSAVKTQCPVCAGSGLRHN